MPEGRSFAGTPAFYLSKPEARVCFFSPAPAVALANFQCHFHGASILAENFTHDYIIVCFIGMATPEKRNRTDCDSSNSISPSYCILHTISMKLHETLHLNCRTSNLLQSGQI